MSSKVAILVYHKNILDIYSPVWIEQFITSIRSQRCLEFQVYEMNYGTDSTRLFHDSIFFQEQHKNFVYAMNRLIELSDDCDYLFNTNCDDWYDVCRIQQQVEALDKGYDVVSSNFALVDTDGHLIKIHDFDELDLNHELNKKKHNIICHPVVAYRRSFFKDFQYVPEEIPTEDMRLWQRAVKAKKFVILPEVLCYHRIHNNAVCRSNNR